MRRFAAIVFLLLVMPGMAAAVPFLQEQGNAARTGVMADPGPERLDLAFGLSLPGFAAPASPPVIIGDSIYMLLEAFDDADPVSGIRPAGLWRVNVTDATMEQIGPIDGPAASLASDGAALFFIAGAALHAVRFDGSPRWSPVALPIELRPHETLRCAGLAVDGQDVIGACSRRSRDAMVGSEGDPLIVFRADRTRGELVRSWVASAASGELVTSGDPDVYGDHAPAVPTHVAVAADYIAVGERALADVGFQPSQARVWILDRQELSLRGVWNGQLFERAAEGAFGGDTAFTRRETQNEASGLVALDDRVIVNSLDLAALDPADGSVVWRAELRGPQATDVDNPGEVVVIGGDLIAQIPGGIARLDVRTGSLRWLAPAPAPGDAWIITGGMLAVRDVVYSGLWPTPHGVVALRHDDGSKADLWPTGSTVGELAVGEGLLAAVTFYDPTFAQRTAELLVFGAPPAAIGLDVSLDTIYPRLDRAVGLDLDVRDGAQAEGWQATVDWGDGTVTAPAHAMRFEHLYQDANRRDIRVYVTNNAGQEASWSATVFVGEQPPPTLNLMQRAFAPENYDLTFGVLGLVIAFAGGLWAVARGRRHHSVLAQELERLRQIRADGVHDPAGSAERLEAFEERITMGVARHRLTDAQFSVLAVQAGDVRRSLRKRAVAPLAGLISPPFRLALDAALEDGRITDNEAEALRQALQRERMAGDARAKVLGTIEAWRERA